MLRIYERLPPLLNYLLTLYSDTCVNPNRKQLSIERNKIPYGTSIPFTYTPKTG